MTAADIGRAEMRRSLGMLVIIAIVLAACTAETSDPTGATSSLTTSEGSAVADIDEYVQRRLAIRADGEARLVSLMEGIEQPPEPTLGFVREIWVGFMDVLSAEADALDALEVPAALTSAHEAYLTAYQDIVSSVREAMAGFVSLEEFGGYHLEDFFTSPRLTADHPETLFRLGASCYSLDLSLIEAAQAEQLPCPPIAVVEIDAGEEWNATTQVAPVGGWLELRVTNNGVEAMELVVIEIVDGDPFDLPVVDGMVDLSQADQAESSGATFNLISPASSYAPGEGFATKTASENTIVVFDNGVGRFEAGAVIVITRSASPS